MIQRRLRPERRGAIAPLTAMMLVVLFGMLAFSIDTAWMVTTRSELQNAADASALAGAEELYKNYTFYNLPGQSTANKVTLVTNAVANAKSTAKAYAGYNAAGGVSSLALADSDISVGFTDANGGFSSYVADGPYPNTVKVLIRRDSTSNNPLRLFFGHILGTSTADVRVSATATLYTGVVTSFSSKGSRNAAILPFTYDADHWANFLKTGQDPDGGKTYDSKGNPEIQVYPSLKYTGNFGQLSLNDSNIGTSTQVSWLNNGVPPSDIKQLEASGLIPLANHDATQWDWQGSSGFASSLIQGTNDNVGGIYWLPLFKASNADQTNYQAGTGSGNYYNFNIVAFVPIQITSPQNKNRQVVIQPANLTDEFADFDLIQPAGTGSTSAYSFSSLLPPRLSN